jgi:hypothetical protein
MWKHFGDYWWMLVSVACLTTSILGTIVSLSH